MRNYQNGRHKEIRILNKLKRLYPNGVGARSAGSHSIIDVWFIDPNTHQVYLIQSKLGKLCKPEKKRILDELAFFPVVHKIISDHQNENKNKK